MNKYIFKYTEGFSSTFCYDDNYESVYGILVYFGKKGNIIYWNVIFEVS